MVIFVVKGVTHIARNLKIKVARAEKDMTQKALAEAVGISRQTMNAIEQGEYNPTIRLCRAICRVLGKSLDDLFGEEDADEEENRTNRLDEMQNQKLMKLEEYGFWIMFWTLLASIVVQLILGCSLKEVLGEIVVFLIGSVYLTATTLKNGLWERTSTPSRKGNAAVSAVPAILIGIINVLKIIQNDKADTKSILITIAISIVVYAGCFIILEVLRTVYNKRRTKLDDIDEKEGE